jgi:hypothetical protein
MTPNNSHVAGLELALDAAFEAGQNGDDMYRAIYQLCAKAKAVPAEPVQGEAVAWLDLSKLAKTSMAYATSMRCTGLQSPLYTHPAKPDAELVELLREARGYVSARAVGPMETNHLLRRIDTKLAELRKVTP